MAIFSLDVGGVLNVTSPLFCALNVITYSAKDNFIPFFHTSTLLGVANWLAIGSFGIKNVTDVSSPV